MENIYHAEIQDGTIIIREHYDQFSTNSLARFMVLLVIFMPNTVYTLDDMDRKLHDLKKRGLFHLLQRGLALVK